MEFAAAVAARRMVRRFDAHRPVAPDALDAVLAAALAAPSAGHTQAVEFVVHRGDDVDTFWAATTRPVTGAGGRWLDGMRTAPVVVSVWTSEHSYRASYAEPDKRHAELSAPWWWVDAGMAVEALLLALTDQGLAGCFFGVPTAGQPALARELGVPAGRAVVGAVALGHPTADASAAGSRGSRGRRRRGTERLHEGRW